MDDVEKKLIDILKRVTGKDFEKLNKNDKIKEDLGLNSISMIMIMLEIEKEFKIFISDMEFEKFITVEDVINLIKK